MKKMLMWLSPIPFIIIAFGWAFSGNKEVTDHTSYYIGTGSVDTGSVAAGGQNNEYSLIGVDVKITKDGDVENIRYVINESVDGIALEDMSILGEDGVADPAWTLVGTDVTGGIKGSSIRNNGWEKDKNNLEIISDSYYTNEGQSLKEVFDVIPYKFHQEDDMVNSAREVNSYVEKNSINYSHTDYDYATEKALVEKVLRTNYPTCTEVNAIVEGEIQGYAEVKADSTNPHAVTGGIATNTGLYYAAALTTAVEACA